MLMTTVQRIRTMIETGQYPLHSQLPSERELSELLGVGRATIRRALTMLEDEGRVWRHVGQGTFVGGQPGSVVSNLKTLSARTSPSEIFELRLLLEPGIARMAAMRASSTNINYLNFCIRKADEAKDWETYELWDNTFHRTIAECTKSVLLITIVDMIGQLRRLAPWGRLRDATFCQANYKQGRSFHKSLVGAITTRDLAGAEKIMRKHIETARSKMMNAGERIKFEEKKVTLLQNEND